MALSEPIKESTRPACSFDVERVSERVDLVLGDARQGDSLRQGIR
jgi:hypothetical protein